VKKGNKPKKLSDSGIFWALLKFQPKIELQFLPHNHLTP
jgi:hypothetical protein